MRQIDKRIAELRGERELVSRALRALERLVEIKRKSERTAARPAVRYAPAGSSSSVRTQKSLGG